jgi:hypothetical protein
MKLTCPHCGKECDIKTGYVNRAIKLGVPIYCTRVCSGLARRKNYTDDQKKQIKADYDRQYRANNEELIKVKKSTYYKTEAGRALQKRNREKFKESHKEYVKTERYRLGYKQQYDKKYHAKKKYGEFFEASIILDELEKKIQPERLEAKIQNGIVNKSQKRKRLWNSLQKI